MYAQYWTNLSSGYYLSIERGENRSSKVCTYECTFRFGRTKITRHPLLMSWLCMYEDEENVCMTARWGKITLTDVTHSYSYSTRRRVSVSKYRQVHVNNSVRVRSESGHRVNVSHLKGTRCEYDSYESNTTPQRPHTHTQRTAVRRCRRYFVCFLHSFLVGRWSRPLNIELLAYPTGLLKNHRRRSDTRGVKYVSGTAREIQRRKRKQHPSPPGYARSLGVRYPSGQLRPDTY